VGCITDERWDHFVKTKNIFEKAIVDLKRLIKTTNQWHKELDFKGNVVSYGFQVVVNRENNSSLTKYYLEYRIKDCLGSFGCKKL